MTAHTRRTALITGTSSGIGMEAAAQFARAGYSRVIVTARTPAKAGSTAATLRAQVGDDVVQPLALDLDDLASVRVAAAQLVAAASPIDVLVLNAGVTPHAEIRRTTDGIESMAAPLVGHHLLTTLLLEAGLLAENARIVIAGSEAARGDTPMFTPVDLDSLARREFDGDLELAVEAVMRVSGPVRYQPNNQYASAKMFVTWWAAELATRLPAGTTVVAVSPGNTPDTNAATTLPPLMRHVMFPLMKLVPGMSHTVADGASRYLQAVDFGQEANGQFFASKPKKMTGALHRIDGTTGGTAASRAALWNATERAAHAGAPRA
ncbi:SDR family NAD(P)-dependent oxidoreductase [Actinotalea sp.]|uniref:SDR family NAD(P)-dependent oxidoreductase n=1 Tax=Actinotalea sp. TaxID=1872145 RepID=UPI00356A7097